MSPFDPYSAPARAANVALRTVHLAAMAVLAGGLAYEVPAASLRAAIAATVLSGAALLLSEMSHGKGWLLEGRGILALAHVGLLGLLAAAGLPRAGAGVALVVGALGSHLPRTLRRWSLRTGRPPSRGGGARDEA